MKLSRMVPGTNSTHALDTREYRYNEDGICNFHRQSAKLYTDMLDIDMGMGIETHCRAVHLDSERAS
jgi:hypothetical protein